ncbi:GNAT family N-acetyltransferase [Ruminococcus sp.]|uniref:GNAT family N-acetyltransferase n=1 Tax=Ruminococcus sp. TaxID=41978 RepID=UPI0025DDB929|nr:GNAT family N-acetyltransferase [Ruminococcus sp.]
MSKTVRAPELYTERLVLKEITESDATYIVKLRANPNVYRYFVSPHKITMEEHLKWYRDKYIYDDSRFDWIACSEKNGPIGLFGIKRESADSDIVEVSYMLSPEHYRKGYAREAVERLIKFCKDEWKCCRVIAEIHKDNSASIRFIERLSFVLEEYDGDFVIYGKEI